MIIIPLITSLVALSVDVKAKSTTDGKNVSSKPVTKAAAIQ